MSPASKSKSKSHAKASKEQPKASSKLSGSSSGNGSPANAYNLISGTFHSLEAAIGASSLTFTSNGRFHNIDDTDENSSSSHGTGAEYDSISNTGSCSGESEDPKDKCVSPLHRMEPIPGADNDKREKIRQKNERKHQRQREKRTQELHDRCCGYLMSRKLEGLTQQLVAMGFSSERATLALILNDGKLEESVSWLFEGSEEADKHSNTNFQGGGENLKIDITEELDRVAALGGKYKCTNQEVERAVVASEGDVDKAEEMLRAQKKVRQLSPPKSEEIRSQEKLTTSIAIQHRRNERDLSSYAKTIMSTGSESLTRNLQSVKLSSPTQLVDKRWPPSVTGSEVQVRGRNFQLGPTVREPVIMMQRPQSTNAKQNKSAGSSLPVSGGGWFSSDPPGMGAVKSNRSVLFSQNQSNMESFSAGNMSSQKFYNQQQYMASRSTDHLPTSRAPGSTSPPLTVPSSLGLFSGWGSAGNVGQVDWNTGGRMPQCDYNSIDWTLDSPPSKSRGMWMGLPSLLRSSGVGGANVVGKVAAGEVVGMTAAAVAPAGSREWTSPFAGNDIFTLPRQFATTPTP